ncbi:uncharacterized protein [Arachis hypogaea]|uniref:uncharacterized protein n=1 Tax=Arachis hypogaea TaxID=3818 RepID=UPI003B218C5D
MLEDMLRTCVLDQLGSWDHYMPLMEFVYNNNFHVALLPHLSNLHDVFHVSQLRKYTPNATHVLEPKSVELKENLTFQVTPMKVDDTSVKKLHRKEVLLVKVAWRRAGMEEHTWELDSEMRKDYPGLFSGKF